VWATRPAATSGVQQLLGTTLHNGVKTISPKSFDKCLIYESKVVAVFVYDAMA
jgi:hypothetical protein